MKRILCTLFVAALVATIVTGAAAQSKKFTVKDLPESVRTAFAGAYPKAEIRGVDKETEKGIVYYEVESVDGKIKRDLLYTVDGKVFECEEGLSADALPVAVSAGLEKKHPGYSFVRGEKVVRGSVVTFSVVYNTAKKTFESAITQEGKITTTKEVKGRK